MHHVTVASVVRRDHLAAKKNTFWNTTRTPEILQPRIKSALDAKILKISNSSLKPELEKEYDEDNANTRNDKAMQENLTNHDAARTEKYTLFVWSHLAR